MDSEQRGSQNRHPFAISNNLTKRRKVERKRPLSTSHCNKLGPTPLLAEIRHWIRDLSSKQQQKSKSVAASSLIGSAENRLSSCSSLSLSIVGMSIANRDASLQCISNAREASQQNNLDRAIQLCEKSLRLFETDEARTLLASLKSRQGSQTRDQARKDSATDLSSAAKAEEPSHHTPRGSYTKREQQAAALAVRNTKCYYARLNIETKCNDVEVIKRAYKKRAFQFHPDKNNAPASADAFKAINQAYECLIDDQRKAAYDHYGTEDPQAENVRSSGAYRAGREDVLTPEDILNMFFASGGQRMPQFQRRRARPHHSHDPNDQQHRQATPLFQMCMQFLPVVFLLMFSMWSGPIPESAGQPGINNGLGEVFTLEKTNGFMIQRSTPDQNLVYFVRPQFSQWYGHDKRALARIEHLVTLAHAQALKKQCELDIFNRDAAITKAKGMIGDRQPEALAEAHAFPLAACDKLSAIYSH